MNAKPLAYVTQTLAVALWLMVVGAVSAQPGVPVWTNCYDGPANGFDKAEALAVDSAGNVVVTGTSYGGSSDSNSDYVTIKYLAAPTLPIPLNYQIVGNQLVLSWSNAAFDLQSAPTVQGIYTNIPSTTSPFTNAFSGTQRYFRLRGN